MKGQGMIQPGKLDLTLAKLKKGGEHFEIVIDPDQAIAFKNKKLEDIREVLKSEMVFTDSNKGLKASETKMQEVFGTSDPLEVSKIILEDGEVHFTSEYREQIRETKRKRVLDLIHRNAIDPRTKLPHPMQRLENAFKESKAHIDMFKPAEEQVEDVLSKIRPVLPIRIEVLNVEIRAPSQYAHQTYRLLKQYGKIKKEAWGSDGGISVKLELPAGIQEEFLDKLNGLSKGSADFNIIKE